MIHVIDKNKEEETEMHFDTQFKAMEWMREELRKRGLEINTMTKDFYDKVWLKYNVSLKSEAQENEIEKQKVREDIKYLVMKEYAKGNIVVAGFEGIQAMPLKEFLKQPADGMLYDLNRNEAVVLTFIEDPKWINDYAVAKVIQELKRQIDELANPK